MRWKCGDGSAGVGRCHRDRNDELICGKRNLRASLESERPKPKTAVSQGRNFVGRVEEHTPTHPEDCFRSRLIVCGPRQPQPGSKVIPSCLPQRGSLRREREGRGVIDVSQQRVGISTVLLCRRWVELPAEANGKVEPRMHATFLLREQCRLMEERRCRNKVKDGRQTWRTAHDLLRA